MTTETITIVVSEKGARIVKRNIEDIGKSSDKAAGGVNMLKGALAGIATYFGGRELLRFVDSITVLQTQLRNVTRNTSEYTQKFNALFSIAQRTGDSLDGMVNMFVRLNSALPNAIRQTTDLTKVTELLSRGLAISGANAQQTTAVMIQLSQGLAGNFANAAQEINSLIEGAPLLARIISEQLGGKAATDLKRMAEAGELTTESFLKALLAAEAAIGAYTIPPTIERSWQRVKNAIVEMGAESLVLRQAAAGLASVMDSLSRNVDMLAKALGIAAAAWGAYWLAVNLGAIRGTLALVVGSATAFIQLATTVRSAAGAMALLNAAFMLSPVGLLAGLITALTAGYFLLGKNTDALTEQTGRLNKIQQAGYDLSMKLVTASGERKKALEAERTQLLATARAEVEAARVALNASLARYDELQRRGRGIIPVYKANKDMEMRLEALKNAQRALEDLKETMKPVQVEPPPPSKNALKQAKKDQEALADAIRDSWTEQERQLSKIKELEGMRGLAKTTSDAEALELAIKRANQELVDMKDEVEKNSPLAKAFESLVNQVDDGFREAFRNAFTQGDGGWRSMLDGWKASFKAFLADLAYTAMARPIILSVLAGIGGGVGLSTGAANSIIGDVGGVGGGGLLSNLSGLANIGSLFKGGLSALNSPIFGAGSMVGGAINWAGAQLGLNNASFIGPMLPGTSNLASAFTPAAGIAGFGGNFLANAIFGDRGIGATIGGTLGGIGGTAIGSSLAMLGSFGGPIGALAGAFLGNVVGGLFGKKGPSAKYQGGQMDLATQEVLWSGGQTGKKFSQANADARDNIGNAIAGYTQLLQAAGASVEGTIGYGVSGKAYHGLGYAIGSKDTRDFSWYKKTEDFIEALFTDITDLADGLGATYKTIIDKVGFKDMDKLAEAFSFGEFFESVVNPVDAVTTAIEAVNKQFDDLIKKADDLGLTNAVFTVEMEKRRQAELDLIKAQQAGFQSLEAMKSTFDKWLYDQSISGTSTLTPAQKLAAAQGNFGSLLTKAQGGDYTVTQDLLAAGQQLLQMGQSMYASSVDFALLEGFVRSSIQQIARDLDIPGYAGGTTHARRGWAWVGEEGPELVRFGGGETVLSSDASTRASGDGDEALISEVIALRKEVVSMRKELSRTTSRLTVEKGAR